MELSEQLRDIAFGTVQEWMRIIEIDPDVQARAYLADDGMLAVGTTRYDASYGTFKLSISVEPLPPLGPESDPAQIEEMRTEPEPARWVPATWGQVALGDRVRLGAQEADVVNAVRQTWHADVRDPYRPKPWEHAVMRIKLEHLEQALDFPAGDPVEILADAGRRAALMLTETFPGTGRVVSSDVD